MVAMRTLLCMLLIAGLMVPVFATPWTQTIPAAPTQAAKPRAAMAALLLADRFDADADGLVADAEPQLRAAAAAEFIYVIEGPATESVRLKTDDLRSTEPATSTVTIGWQAVAAAQGAVAALGAAAQAAPMMGPQVHGLPAATFADATGATAQRDAPAWLIIACWSVFLASLGIVAIVRPGSVSLLAGYARLSGHDVERHPRRALLLALVRSDPGAHLAQLQAAAGLAAGVTRHHLDQLVSHGLLRRIHDGRTTHFYPPEGRPVPPAARSVPRQEILSMLQTDPGLTTRQVAKRLALRVQTTWTHLHRLTAAGLVASVPVGRAHAWRRTAR